MTPPTYAEARAACVARYGREPDDEYAISACARSWWGFDEAGDAGVMLAETHTGAVEFAAIYRATRNHRRTLAGEPTPDAPAATLPDALDDADAFLRTHAPQP